MVEADQTNSKTVIKHKSKYGPSDKWYSIFLISPAMIVLIFFGLVPLFYAIYLSFHFADLTVGGVQGWVGLENFRDAMNNAEFWSSTGRTLIFTAFSVGIEMVLGIILAYMINQLRWFKGAIRALFLLPMASAPAAVGLVWRYLYDPDLEYARQPEHHRRHDLARCERQRHAGPGRDRRLGGSDGGLARQPGATGGHGHDGHRRELQLFPPAERYVQRGGDGRGPRTGRGLGIRRAPPARMVKASPTRIRSRWPADRATRRPTSATTERRMPWATVSGATSMGMASRMPASRDWLTCRSR